MTTHLPLTPAASWSTTGNGSHAVVIGGSMAGLWAGRVLADRFDRVTVIERDRFPLAPERRKGVPQARHVHLLLVQGQRIMERLFPGLGAELTAAGAPAVDWAQDCVAYFGGAWGQRFRSGLITRTCSRDLLEWSIRRRLAAWDNLRFVDGWEVTGLLADPDTDGVEGVLVRRYGQREDAITTGPADLLRADLVVDASGRNSRAPEWLEQLGYARPQETVINSFLGYASRRYRRPTGFAADWTTMVLSSTPPGDSRGGVIYPEEDDRWVVTLTGAARDYPPTDEAGFLAFARSLASPVLYEAIKDAEPLSPIWGYRRTENRLRHYERLRRWPEGFVTLGDAVCAFNPVYGQGMTASALGALALDRCLRERQLVGRQVSRSDLRGLARRFHRQLAKVNATPWLLATGEDFRWPQTEGGRPDRITRLMHHYLDQVLALVAESPLVKQVFLEVLHLVTPPTALFRPAILARVLARAVNPAPRFQRASTIVSLLTTND